MFDYHLHTRYSFDSQADPLDMVRAAVQKGLKEICITDHMDIAPVGTTYIPPLDFAAYEAAFSRIESANPPIPVRRGIELGVTLESIEVFRRIPKEHTFDYILCSQHFIGKDDPYDRVYFLDKTQKEAYQLYLEETLTTLEAFSDYDAIGHIGYATKYYAGILPNRLDYGDHREVIDAILQLAIRQDKALEINTSGLRDTGDTLPTMEIVQRYRELGGVLITLGSDAHTPAGVGAHILETIERLRAIGFTQVATYQNRQPHLVSL